MKLSCPMERFIILAAQSQRWRPSGGIYFSLWSHGSSSTGRALLNRGLIESPRHIWPFQLTDAGWREAMRIHQSGRFKDLKD